MQHTDVNKNRLEKKAFNGITGGIELLKVK